MKNVTIKKIIDEESSHFITESYGEMASYHQGLWFDFRMS
jgi:hypothetical protein